jgi:hypothetical protein
VLEHAAPEPLIVAARPEDRVLNAFSLEPVPIGVGPKLGAMIPIVLYEREKSLIGDVMDVDVEWRHVDPMLIELVIPAEWNV